MLEIEQPLVELRDTSPLQEQLVSRGVSEKTAQELVVEFAEERIRRQIEQADWLKKKAPKKITNFGAFLAQAIRDDYAPPEGFESNAARTERERAQAQQYQRKAEAARRNVERQQREAEDRARVLDYWESLGLAEQQSADTEALGAADETRCQEYRQLEVTRNPVAKVYFRTHIREPFLRAKLGLKPEETA